MILRLLPFLALTVLATSACSNARQSLGLTKTTPDEFKVTKNAPLEMPSSFELPPPRPGAPRPQETAVTEQAKATLLGKTQTSSQPSQAEALLLQQAGADQSAADIRTIVDREVGAVDESNQSVAKRLLGIGEDAAEANVINAEKEAERLKTIKNAN